jgi:hypothetical protein
MESNMYKKQNIIMIGMALLLAWSNMLMAAPKAELIPFWNKSNEASTKTIDHSAWQTILDAYLEANHASRINRFDYKKLKANTADTKKLADYLSALQNLDPRNYNKAEQKAYWINFYNALTVQIVLTEYPVESITKIHQGWFGFGPWDDVHAKVVEQDLTLNQIEHGILRPIWQDNRIHYAVNCASYGCPNLSAKAYTPQNLEENLNKNTRDYVNHERGVEFLEDDYLVISSIYHWYKIDFGNTEENILKHLQKYAQPELAKRLKNFNGSMDHDYNWKLNEP